MIMKVNLQINQRFNFIEMQYNNKVRINGQFINQGNNGKNLQ